jgi:predicted dithiol-disulfide oxidoreductase (DUF899 family)
MKSTQREGDLTMDHNQVISREEWLIARKTLLAKEKELTKAYDELNRQLRELPWVKVEKNYVFDGRNGKEKLADLFGGRSQLIVNHFMLGPGWKEGCVGCSFGADQVEGALTHVLHRDVAYVAISRAPLPEIEAFKKRMGWRFKWVSSFGSDFNYDYQVSFRKDEIAKGQVYYNYEMREFQSEELQGTSVFYKDKAGDIFHTYSRYARGGDPGIGVYSLLDITPKGRDETGPRHDLTDWVRHHDKYEAGDVLGSKNGGSSDSCHGSAPDGERERHS